MRIQEILSADQLQQFGQLIYANVYKALATYQQQQQRADMERQHATTVARLKPNATKRKIQLAHQAKHAPYAPAPKPLPQPPQQLAPHVSAPKSYNPIKAAKPLPAPTRAAIKQPTTAQQGETVKNHGDLDQRTRNMLPPSKRGTPEWALFSN